MQTKLVKTILHFEVVHVLVLNTFATKSSLPNKHGNIRQSRVDIQGVWLLERIQQKEVDSKSMIW